MIHIKDKGWESRLYEELLLISRKNKRSSWKNGQKMSLCLSQESPQWLIVRQLQLKSPLKYPFPPNRGADRGGLAVLSAGKAEKRNGPSLTADGGRSVQALQRTRRVCWRHMSHPGVPALETHREALCVMVGRTESLKSIHQLTDQERAIQPNTTRS